MLRSPIFLLVPVALLVAGCPPSQQPGGNDLAVPADLTVTFDFSSTTPPPDGGGGPRDLSSTTPPPDVAAPRDLTTLPDLTVLDLTACDATCNTPPATACDGNLIRTFRGPGTCGGGACQYPSTTQSCEFGCWNAACVAGPGGGPQNDRFLGNTAAFETGGKQLNLAVEDTVASSKTVSITTQTYPQGAFREVHLLYWTNDTPANQVDLLFTFDRTEGNNQQWFVVIPSQPAGTKVTWYIRADAWGIPDPFYFSNFGANFNYRSQ